MGCRSPSARHWRNRRRRRGVGLNDFNPNTASAVGLYTDGVHIGSPLAQMAQFFDIDRLEVLRGPQGTLYGRNTTGGAIT